MSDSDEWKERGDEEERRQEVDYYTRSPTLAGADAPKRGCPAGAGMRNWEVWNGLAVDQCQECQEIRLDL